MKIPKIYLWLLVPVFLGVIFLSTIISWESLLIFSLVALGFCILVQFIITRIRQDIPRAAVLELLDRCKEEDGWVLVHFKPEVSLAEVRARLDLDEGYTQETREKEFLFKASAVFNSAPAIAVFYSKRKGLLYGNSQAIRTLLQRYGRFMLDNWKCLLGAMLTKDLRVQNLDGGQLFSESGMYLGGTDDLS